MLCFGRENTFKAHVWKGYWAQLHSVNQEKCKWSNSRLLILKPPVQDLSTISVTHCILHRLQIRKQGWIRRALQSLWNLFHWFTLKCLLLNTVNSSLKKKRSSCLLKKHFVSLRQRHGCVFQASKAHWESREFISCLGCPSEHLQPVMLLWAAFLRPFLNIKFLASAQTPVSSWRMGLSEETATTTWVSLDVIKYSANIPVYT